MDVVTPDEARLAEDAGAVAVMALERVPADIRRDGGVARMSDPSMIKEIQEAVTIPVMAKARIGHFAEAQVLQALEVDYVDESEVLTPADEANHIDKHAFEVPFVCGATDLGEALRRIARGRGDDPLQGRGRDRQHRRGGPPPARDRRRHQAARVAAGRGARRARRRSCARRSRWSREVAETGWLPVPLFCAGGIATPADAALTMQLGAEGNFVGSGIFKSSDPERTRAGDRRGDDSLRRSRAGRRRLDRARRADARRRHRRARRRGRAAPAPRDVSAPAPSRQPRAAGACGSGVLASQGDFAAHVRMLRGARRRGGRGPHRRASSTTSTRW